MKSLIAQFAAFILCCSAIHIEAAPPEWKAGVSRAVITPDKSVWMAGYAARKGPSEGVLQDLHAKALALEDAEGGRLVIVTMDLIGVPKSLRLAVERGVLSRHNLPPESLLINASHTHCGPMIRTYKPEGKDRVEIAPYANIPDEEQEQRIREVHEYRAFLEKTILRIIGEALETLEPAKLLYSKGRCGFAMNRRTPTPAGFQNSPNPDGPVDHDVPVLQIRDPEDNLAAVLFGYACHNTTLGIMEFNGDYAGYAQQYFEEDNPGVTALFVTGCAGDQNPYPRRMIHFVEKHGRSLATAIEAGIIANPRPVEGALRAAFAYATLDYAPAPTREELEARLESKDRYDRRHAELLLEELDANGTLPKTYPCPVQVIRFGNDITMATIGGEVCIDYSIRLKRELAEASNAVWVSGYSNDVFAYTPSKRVVDEGGYEGASSMRYPRENLHPGPWAPTIEDRIVGKVHELNRKLK